MLFDMASCGGCRTCELACSLHHTGEFKPAVSSLKILEKKNRNGYQIVIVDRDDERRLRCDGCKGLEVPMCVQYCREGELLEQMVRQFIIVNKS